MNHQTSSFLVTDILGKRKFAILIDITEHRKIMEQLSEKLSKNKSKNIAFVMLPKRGVHF